MQLQAEQNHLLPPQVFNAHCFIVSAASSQEQSVLQKMAWLRQGTPSLGEEAKYSYALARASGQNPGKARFSSTPGLCGQLTSAVT